MGITWIFEVISWKVVVPELCWLWYIIDIFNILQAGLPKEKRKSEFKSPIVYSVAKRISDNVLT